MGTLTSVRAGFPFQRRPIDFVGPLAASSKGNKYILTVKDCFTRWIEAFPIVAATALVVAATALETVNIQAKEIFGKIWGTGNHTLRQRKSVYFKPILLGRSKVGNPGDYHTGIQSKK
jgi:hypothetical protein